MFLINIIYCYLVIGRLIKAILFRFSTAKFGLFQFAGATEIIDGQHVTFGDYVIVPDQMFDKHMDLYGKLNFEEIITICGCNHQIGLSSNHFFVIDNDKMKCQSNARQLCKLYLRRLITTIRELDPYMHAKVKDFLNQYNNNKPTGSRIEINGTSSSSLSPLPLIPHVDRPSFGSDDPYGEDERKYLLNKVT